MPGWKPIEVKPGLVGASTPIADAIDLRGPLITESIRPSKAAFLKARDSMRGFKEVL